MVQVRYTGGGLYFNVMNPWLIMLPGVVACSECVSCSYEKFADNSQAKFNNLHSTQTEHLILSYVKSNLLTTLVLSLC